MFRPSHFLRRMSRWGLAGLLTAGLMAGCGGQTAGPDAVVIIDAVDDTITFADNSGPFSFSPLSLKVEIHVNKDDIIPVPGADITLIVGGSGLSGVTLTNPLTGAILSNALGIFQTSVDDRGAILVRPVGQFPGCPVIPAGGKDVTLSGNLSMDAVIAADTASWSFDFTAKCIAP